jgi:hypothetical protein
MAGFILWGVFLGLQSILEASSVFLFVAHALQRIPFATFPNLACI